MTTRRKTRHQAWLTCGLLALIFATIAPTAGAAPRIDPGFGSGGVARTPLPPSFVVKPFEEIAVAADGGVATRSGSYGEVEVRHYGPDGALTGTETQKEASLNQPPGVGVKLPFSVEAVAPLPSGKELVAGSGVYSLGGTKSPPENQVFVARLGTDGKLDPSFGNAGIVKLRSEYEFSPPTALLVRGRAGEAVEVVTGDTGGERSLVVGLGADGKLDRAFGENGRVETPGTVVGAGAAAGETVLVAGARQTGAAPPDEGPEPEAIYVARYTAAGKLDPAYAGGSGIAVVDAGERAGAGSALIEADGSVLVGGFAQSRPPGCPLGFRCEGAPVVVRLTPDGQPDPSFGQGGVARLAALGEHFVTGYKNDVDALAARPGGGYFVAGATERNAFVAALGADGSLDSRFGGSGIVTDGSTLTAYSAPVATAVDEGGDVFVVAQTDTGPGEFGGNAVLRYSADGRLDGEFGEEGAVFVPPGVRGLAVAPDGSSFVISGESSPNSSLSEVTPTGTIDPSFGAGGSVVFPFPKYRFIPDALVRLGDGDLLVAGNGGRRPAVLRYLPDGKLDPSFGKGGVEVVKLGQQRRWVVKTMAVDRQGRIVLGGSAEHRPAHGCCNTAGALIRLRPDGRLDRTFGRGGGVALGDRSQAAIDGLAVRGNRILAAATFTKYVGLSPAAAGYNLYAIRPDGRLDRGFGKRGVVKSYLPPHRKSYAHAGEETVSVYSTPHHIFLVCHGFYAPLLSFSPSGHPQRNLPRRIKGLLPHRLKENVPLGPVATLDGPSLLLAWGATPLKPEGHGAQAEVNLQRLLLP